MTFELKSEEHLREKSSVPAVADDDIINELQVSDTLAIQIKNESDN